jgi:hypothetical protein
MIQKRDIETILKINGVQPSAPDEEIRSVLLSARYNNDEVDTAMMVLRENNKTHQTRVDGLHKIFHTDEALKPSEISSLLGIEVQLDDFAIQNSRRRDMSFIQTTVVTIVATLLAAAGVAFAMYHYEVGLFHPSASAFGK